MKIRIVSLTLLAALVACASPQDPGVGPDDVAVELDAFSGLPNPQWTLTPAQSAELASRLEGLSTADAALPDPGLGYRGFRVRNPGGEGGIPESLYVSRAGLLQLTRENGAGRVYQDRHGAEDFLIEISTRRGHGDVFTR